MNFASEVADLSTTMAEEENPNEIKEVKEEAGDIAPFDPTKKKKKKKVMIQDPAEDETVDNMAEKTESLSGKLIQQSSFLISSTLFPFCSSFLEPQLCHVADVCILKHAVSDGLETSFAGVKRRRRNGLVILSSVLSL
ncbi:unnamed protein product [Fraxinus pennsylvanica]|uniref:Uncharacterized protein n=1 Tax=Fraxinus pennsylvanica TaxID=56036 RepID=A0AAD1ZJ22_9LAMI|nr:unnamed protein product [Fraxinus pennsylvanica]